MSPRHEKPKNDNALERIMIRLGLLYDTDGGSLPLEAHIPKHLSDEAYRSLGRPPLEMQRLNQTEKPVSE